jgi:hypothetical protein
VEKSNGNKRAGSDKSGAGFAGLAGLASVASLAITAIGCGGNAVAASEHVGTAGAGAPHASADGVAEGNVHDGVIVATSEESNLAVVVADRIEWPLTAAGRLASLASGSILVGEASRLEQSGNPTGFLRRVTKVTSADGKLLVWTRPAALTDLFHDAHLHTEGRLTRDQLARVPDRAFSSTSPQERWELSPYEIDFGNRTLFEKEAVAGAQSDKRAKATVRLQEGKVSFAPAFEADVSLGWFRVNRFSVGAEGRLAASAVLAASLESNDDSGEAMGQLVGIPLEGSASLYESGDIALPTMWIGAVPIVQSVRLGIGVHCRSRFEGQVAAHAGVRVDAFAKATAVYARGSGWSTPTDGSFDAKPSFTLTTKGVAEARCAIDTSVYYALYGSASAGVIVSPYLEAAIRAPQAADGPHAWSVYPGVRGRFAGKLELFGYELGAAEFEMFDWRPEAPLAGGEF